MFTKSLDHQISFTADIEERGGAHFFVAQVAYPVWFLL